MDGVTVSVLGALVALAVAIVLRPLILPASMFCVQFSCS